MDTVASILIGCCIALCAANVLVCLRVATSHSYDLGQKIVQCVMIWLLPIAGAGIAYAFTREPSMSVRSGTFVGIGDGDGSGGSSYSDHCGHGGDCGDGGGH